MFHGRRPRIGPLGRQRDFPLAERTDPLIALIERHDINVINQRRGGFPCPAPGTVLASHLRVGTSIGLHIVRDGFRVAEPIAAMPPAVSPGDPLPPYFGRFFVLIIPLLTVAAFPAPSVCPSACPVKR